MLEHLFPTHCLICDAQNDTFCCLPCLADLPWVSYHCVHCRRAVPHPNTSCPPCLTEPSTLLYTVPLLYQPPISQIITAFKLNQQEHLCRPLVSIFESRFTNKKPDLLIPVPSHPKRMWERGYNPALLIARQMGKALGIPVDDRAVIRTQHGAPQRLQKKQARSHHLSHAFEVVALPRGKHIALVDDVVTTGSTLRALANVVAPFTSHIECWAIAESPHLAVTLNKSKNSEKTT